MTYFDFVCGALTYEDLNLMSIIFDAEATCCFKSIPSKQVHESSGYSESVYRRIFYRLNGASLVGVVPSKKQYGVYLTDFGCQALTKSLQEVGA